MSKTLRQNGFSLTEVLIATAILAIGLMMIAMAFPVGVKLTSLATERTVGTVAANEAFAKFRLYSQDPDGAGNIVGIDCSRITSNSCMDLPSIISAMNQPSPAPNVPSLNQMSNDELWYPSIVPARERKYHWSMLARQTNVNELQLTVFVTRVMDTGTSYYIAATPNNIGIWPQPIKLNCFFMIANPAKARELKINTTPNFTIQEVDKFIIEGTTIVDDRLGIIYRVVERKDTDLPADGIREILLDKDWQDNLTANPQIWVVPPAVGSTRNPCIFVQQRTIRF